MKIIFFGTPAFAVPFFSELLRTPGIEVAAVVTQPDKPVGRHRTITVCPVKEQAVEQGIRVLQPQKLKEESAIAAIRDLQADLFVIVAYGKIIPPSILALPRLGCVNLHPSLLPKYRGPSPIQCTIAEGDSETGLSVMLIDAGMDTGPLLAQKKIPLEKSETVESLVRKIHDVGPGFLGETILAYAAGTIKPMPQASEGVSVTHLLDREDGRIDWKKSAEAIERQFRAYHPWPGIWTAWERNGKPVRLKLLRINVETGSLPPGKVESRYDQLLVGTGEKLIRIVELQAEGSSPTDSPRFIRGHADITGAAFV